MKPISISNLYGHKLINNMSKLGPCTIKDGGRIRWELIKHPGWLLRVARQNKDGIRQAWRTGVGFWLMRLTSRPKQDSSEDLSECECQ